MNQTSHIVRTIYFKPVGILEVPKKKIRTLMQDSQAFYRAEMERHRYGTKTFRLETDRNDEVVVYTVNGKKQAEAYTSYQDIEPELPPELREKNNIHVIFMGGLRFVKDSNAWGVGFSYYGSACGASLASQQQVMVCGYLSFRMNSVTRLDYPTTLEMVIFLWGRGQRHLMITRHS